MWIHLGCALVLLSGWSCQVAAQRTVMELYGAGSTLCTMEMTQLTYNMMSSAKPPVYSAYRAIGTGSGRDELLMGLTNTTSRPAYTMMGLPLPASNFTAAQAAGGVITVPTMMAKIGFFHSVRTANGSAQVLNLTACALAQIYTGQITRWTDAIIMATNPNLMASGNLLITVLRRKSLFSPSQTAVVNFFSSTCSAGGWTLGMDAPSVTWPATHLPMDEDLDMIGSLSTPWKQAKYVPNAIGFIDSALGLLPQYSLMEVAVQWMGAGSSFITAGQSSSSALTDMASKVSWPALDADWSTFSIQSSFAPSATLWPLVLTPFFISLKNATWLNVTGGLMLGALSMLLDNSMQGSVTTNGHVSLPSTTRANLVQQAAALIQLDPSSPRWVYERDGQVLKGAGADDYVFSFFRVSGLTFPVQSNNVTLGDIAIINDNLVNIWSNLSIAQTVRSQLQQTIAQNDANEAQIRKATQIAVAGVVLSVILAFIALILAAVHVGKLKQVDAKYAKYISLGKFTAAKPSVQDDGF